MRQDLPCSPKCRYHTIVDGPDVGFWSFRQGMSLADMKWVDCNMTPTACPRFEVCWHLANTRAVGSHKLYGKEHWTSSEARVYIMAIEGHSQKPLVRPEWLTQFGVPTEARIDVGE